MAFGPVVNLSSLDGANGFRISGETAYDRSGFSVSSAGDVNGDGFDDVIVGAFGADPNGSFSGASYVVFGKASGFTADLNLAALDGANGFQISGEAAYDRSGRSVSLAGDVNGDGFGDVIVGANDADPNGSFSGASYVVFGKAGGFAADLDLSALDGANGFRISGEAAYGRSGRSVSTAGDVNGDGFDDVIVGARDADPNGSSSGASYVVFGKAGGFAADLDLSALDGLNGFQISGEVPNDYGGRSVSSAGDVNGDGFDDVIVGADGAGPNGPYSGASYVVFGKAGGFAANLSLSTLNGLNGFRIDGEAAYDQSGRSVSSAGDVNGDGFDDLIVGADGANPKGSFYSGASYVVFGDATGSITRVGTAADEFFAGGSFDDNLQGGDGNDRLRSNGGDDRLSGGVGTDTLDAGAGDDRLDGGSGDDTLDGGADDDQLLGGSGLDSLSGGGGIDALVGGEGDDALDGGEGSDFLHGGSGHDGLGGGAGDDRLSGSDGADGLTGGAGFDTLAGGVGNDTLDGGESADVLNGGFGLDTLLGGLSDDRLFGFDGNDSLDGGSGLDALFGGADDDRLFGRGGDDFLDGDGRDDTLVGGNGDDRLFGEDGGDVLTGGAGRDVLAGGADADRFVFFAATDSPAGTGRDRITDFETGLDRIDLRPIDSDGNGANGDGAFAFLGSGAFTGAGAELRFVQAGSVTLLSADLDGDQVSDFEIALAGAPALGGGDFLL